MQETMTAWCMRCRDHKVVNDPKAKHIRGVRGDRLQLQGKCPDCGAIVNRFSRNHKAKPSPSNATETVVQKHPRSPQRKSRITLNVVSYYRGPCKRCGDESRFTGDLVGKRYDGKLVIRGQCHTCRMPQVVVGAFMEDSDDEE